MEIECREELLPVLLPTQPSPGTDPQPQIDRSIGPVISGCSGLLVPIETLASLLMEPGQGRTGDRNDPDLENVDGNRIDVRSRDKTLESLNEGPRISGRSRLLVSQLLNADDESDPIGSQSPLVSKWQFETLASLPRDNPPANACPDISPSGRTGVIRYKDANVCHICHARFENPRSLKWVSSTFYDYLFSIAFLQDPYSHITHAVHAEG